jgi:hypothetical protein
MNMQRLFEIITETTICYRKGPEVVEREEHGVKVMELFGFPPTPEKASPSMPLVDVHFITIGVKREQAMGYRSELQELLATYPQFDRLQGGPSYIEMGDVLKDQEMALRLFALGEVIGFWRVVTPKILGIDGEMADELAGGGMILITGYTPA